jgi:energy-coupling factor transporter ATP-binding protein EcfA2
LSLALSGKALKYAPNLNSPDKIMPQDILDQVQLNWPQMRLKSWHPFEASMKGEAKQNVEEAVISEQIECTSDKKYYFFPEDKYKDIFPTRTIKVRTQYTELIDWILDNCVRTNAIVIGDPGIGKSTMLKILFVVLKSKGETVFWAMESGKWVYCINNVITTGRDSNDKKSLWEPNNVWLLIDGKASKAHLRKMCRAVVFSSPQRGNYNTFMKTANAMRLVLPPWSKEEIKSLFSASYKNYPKYFPNGPPGFELMMPFWTYLKSAYRKLNPKDKEPAEQRKELDLSDYKPKQDSPSHSKRDSDCTSNLKSSPAVKDLDNTTSSSTSKSSPTVKDLDNTTSSSTSKSVTAIDTSSSDCQFSCNDLEKMYETLERISTQAGGVITPEEVLDFISYPAPTRVRESILDKIRKISESQISTFDLSIAELEKEQTIELEKIKHSEELFEFVQARQEVLGDCKEEGKGQEVLGDCEEDGKGQEVLGDCEEEGKEVNRDQGNKQDKRENELLQRKIEEQKEQLKEFISKIDSVPKVAVPLSGSDLTSDIEDALRTNRVYSHIMKYLEYLSRLFCHEG